MTTKAQLIPFDTSVDYTSWKPDPTAGSYQLPRELPEEHIGKCLVCGAGFREHISCDSGNCHFVRIIEGGLS